VSNPFIRRAWLAGAAGFVVNVKNVWALAVIKRTFKQLPTKQIKITSVKINSLMQQPEGWIRHHIQNQSANNLKEL